ncbi:copper amine oxidase N-terminal domain-containing protein [Aminipila butyrica]|uniref:Copper amine oxidase N-terminal domain-containing protein n=1 Tax=Aminipila butyrica TaxID=433296 RepID=A0A858BWV2_9FIRM|nr:copper amine oxidase N-terminal domain-containing protein [Aminipila butyrica]QIB70047.1 copper amine oxidase N-terminal domain-containing protein [Aminipila butyrica]
MKKRLLSTTIIFTLVVSSFSCVYATNINVNGEGVQFTKETGAPYVDANDRTQVPLRITMEKAGATVSWDKDTKTATVEKYGKVVRVPVGAKYILVDGKQVETDTTAVIIEGRTYLPIRPVLEAAGFSVQWDQTTQTVYAANFTDYINNQEKVLTEQGQNIKTVNDLIEYYKGSWQLKKDKEVATALAERDVLSRYSQPTGVFYYFEWYDGDYNSLKEKGIEADYSAFSMKREGDSYEDRTYIFSGTIILKGKGSTVTIDVPEYTLLKKDLGTIKEFDGVTIEFGVSSGIDGMAEPSIKFKGEDLYKLGLLGKPL